MSERDGHRAAVVFWIIVAAIVIGAIISGTLLVRSVMAQTAAPVTAEEWWGWFDSQKGKVVKEEAVSAGTAERRPLVTEMTLSDPKALPAGIWGVRRYRKYLEEKRGGVVAGLWIQGEYYEVLWAAASAAVAVSKTSSWEEAVSKDQKYNLIAASAVEAR